MKLQGFSLIEMMLVLVITGIFITFAYPSYQKIITDSRRLDGKTALIDLANRMEGYYSEQHTYQGATLGLGASTDVLSSIHSKENGYLLRITKQTDNDYSLQAVPIGAQARDDKSCQTLSLNSFGLKEIKAGPSGSPTANPHYCWQ